MKRLLFAIACLVGLSGTALAQAPQMRGTLNGSVAITTGNTFQSILAAPTGGTRRLSLTIQNNQTTTDNCWLFMGATASATKATSILLAPGQSYTRYYPYIPSDNIAATCASTSDTLYVDTQ
jgi:hypothetical protein